MASMPNDVSTLMQATGTKPVSFEQMSFKGHIPKASAAALGNAGTINLINQSNKLGFGQVPTSVAKGGPVIDIQLLDINNIPLLLSKMPIIGADVANENAERLKELAIDVFKARGAGPGKAGNHVPGGRPVPWEVSAFTIRERTTNKTDQPLLDTGQLVNSLTGTVVPGGDGELIAMVGMKPGIHRGTEGRSNRKNGKSALEVAELMAILEDGSSNWKAGGFKWFARVGQALADSKSPIVNRTLGEVLFEVQRHANISVQDAIKLRATQRVGGALAKVIATDKEPVGSTASALS